MINKEEEEKKKRKKEEITKREMRDSSIFLSYSFSSLYKV